MSQLFASGGQSIGVSASTSVLPMNIQDLSNLGWTGWIYNKLFINKGHFLNKSVFWIRWPKYWSFSFNISPSNEHPGQISFRMDLLDLHEVQGTLKSLLQNHSSKASLLRCSAFFLVQLSHPYMTNGKTIALTRQTFVDKVISLLFNMLSKESEVSQSCLTLCDPVDSSLPGSCVHRILQARILE